MSLKLGLRNKIRRSRSAGAGFTGLLDQSFASGATAAYSLRRLKISATKAVRVREDSGNTETDIGFSGGTLDETALLNHCGSNNGFVTKWYDQSGNGNDASNSTATEQPQIVSSGSVIQENEKPALQFDGSDNFLQSLFSQTYSQPISIIDVFKLEQTKAFVARDGNSSNGQRVAVTTGGGAFSMFAGSSIDGATIDTNQHLFFCLYNFSNSEFYQDGVIQNSGNSGSNNIGGLTIGAIDDGSDFYANQKYQELVIYTDDQTSNRDKIESNINNYYSIYP